MCVLQHMCDGERTTADGCFSPATVDPGDSTPAVRLVVQCFHLLSHLTSSVQLYCNFGDDGVG